MRALNGCDLVLCGLFLIISCVSCEYYNHSEINNNCVDLRPQMSMDMEQLMGMWNGIEIIQHIHRDHREFHHKSVKICPVILISEVSSNQTPNPYDQYGPRYGYDSATYPSFKHPQNLRRYEDRNFRNWRNLSLLWDEGSFTVEYKLRYDKTRPGLWLSSGARNSTSSSMMGTHYDSFTGHVDVIKAVGTHLVLTFCHIVPRNELFTIILSRSLELSPQDVESVHNLMSRKNLTSYSVQRVCQSGGINLTTSPLEIGFLTIVLYLVGKYAL